jgi:hypothetical protein
MPRQTPLENAASRIITSNADFWLRLKRAADDAKDSATSEDRFQHLKIARFKNRGNRIQETSARKLPELIESHKIPRTRAPGAAVQPIIAGWYFSRGRGTEQVEARFISSEDPDADVLIIRACKCAQDSGRPPRIAIQVRDVEALIANHVIRALELREARDCRVTGCIRRADVVVCNGERA